MTRSHLLMAAAEKLQTYERVQSFETIVFGDIAVSMDAYASGSLPRGYADVMAVVADLLAPHLRDLVRLAQAKILADANEALVAAGCAPIRSPQKPAAPVGVLMTDGSTMESGSFRPRAEFSPGTFDFLVGEDIAPLEAVTIRNEDGMAGPWRGSGLVFAASSKSYKKGELIRLYLPGGRAAPDE